MTDKHPTPPPQAFKVGDLLYVIFRHKWKILIISTLAVAAALTVPFFRPVPFQSDAKLYIRYVLQNPVPSLQGAADPNVHMPEMTSDTIMNTEMQLMTTLEVAQKVAAAVGPEKLLGRGATAADTNQAAGVILKNLALEVPKSTSILLLTFKHVNPEVVQPVLRQLIDAYLEKHRDARESGALDERLTQEEFERRNRLARARDALQAAKSKIGIASVEETKRAYTDQMAKLGQAIFDTEAELAERQAVANAMAHGVPAQTVASTNAPTVKTNDVAAFAGKLDEYKSVCSLLETLRSEEQRRLLIYTRSSTLVKEIQTQIKENEALKHQLEKDYPGLATVSGTTTTTTSATAAVATGQSPEYATAIAQVSALQKKIDTLKDNLAKVQAEVTALNQAEGTIADAEGAVEREEAQYKHFMEQLDRVKTEERLGAGQVSNIYRMQEPTPPYRTGSKLYKLMAMICLGGVGGAIGLAFLIEFYLDQSMRRPAEVEARLGLPLFISVPRLHAGGTKALGSGKVPLLAHNNGHSNGGPGEPGPIAVPGAEGLEMAPWDTRHELRPFSETLRDRLISYFEAKNLTHKPKLVAITGCGRGSGISTVAAGLAASLSETGEGNVLLVNMNQQGGAHHFYRGDLACGLDDALEKEKRDHALVQDNLYVVSEKNETLPSALPRRFQHLVPRLKASDFDYIIFDMPPVNQISVTPRLARFMDMNLLVVESEKTDREVVKRCSSLLAESKANVGIVLNKCRQYVPHRLQEEI